MEDDNHASLALQFSLETQPEHSILSGNDNEDLFFCGKCKQQFSLLSLFISHKQMHCSVQLETIQPVNNDANNLIYSEIVPVPEQGFAQPIALTDSEFLCMDQENINIGATSEVLDVCNEFLTLNTGQEHLEFQVPSIAQDVDMISHSSNIEKYDDKTSKKEKDTNGEEINGDILFNPSPEKTKCGYCGKSFTTNHNLQIHVRAHTGERPFQCVVCGRAFSQKSNVKRHMETHKVWPKHIKNLDFDLFSNNSSEVNNDACLQNDELNKNCEELNVDRPVIESSYVCQFCSDVSTSYHNLKTHCSLVHCDQKVYMCVQKKCKETFKDLDSFLEHTQSHENEAEYHCHVCNAEFNSLDELGLHQYRHSAPTFEYVPKVFTCKICKKKYPTLDALKRHKIQESHVYPCSQCNRIFHNERSLRKHGLTHSTEAPFICTHCSRAFKTNIYLKRHILTHSNEKPYKCQFCDASFSRRNNLSRHTLVHENLKPYECPFIKSLHCTKAFRRKDKLKNHILTHISRLKHVCKLCCRVFSKDGLLKRHEKICSKKKSSKSDSKYIQKDNGNLNNQLTSPQNDMSTIEIIVVPVTEEHSPHENANLTTETVDCEQSSNSNEKEDSLYE